jgi:citrate/tricarballylate utilization protein
MSQIREETYEGLSVPRQLSPTGRGKMAALLAVVAVIFVVGATWIALGTDDFFATYEGSGAFYEVVPFAAMTVPALAIVAFSVFALYLGGRRFMRIVSTSPVGLNGSDFPRTLYDVLLFRNMRGGGPGCNYPEENLSQGRRLAHSLVFYGFGLTLASTTLAAIYQDVFGLHPPYDLASAPVLLGLVGGVFMVIACFAMLDQKVRSRRILESKTMKGMDISFIVLILLINVSGLILLAARATALMGLLLTVHLGLVLAFLVTLPYGKFVHGIYRTLALYRNASEEAEPAKTR